MLKLNYKRFRLPFEYPFRHAKGEKTYQDSLLVSLNFGNYTGYGEATEIPYYQVSVEAMEAKLLQHKSAIESYALNGPERFWHFLHHLLPGQEFLIAALDMAGWDLWGQMSRKPVRRLLRMPAGSGPPTNYTIGITSPEALEARLHDKSFDIYKLKVERQEDLETLRMVSEKTGAAIRIDANESWNLDEALNWLPHLNSNRVQLIEQPFPVADTEALNVFKQHTDIPVIADEACKTPEDLDACLSLYDGINIKLLKCGGLTPAFQMVIKIKQQRKLLMLGGMCESYVGSTAIAQLLPVCDFADIDGPLLLRESSGAGIRYGDSGKIICPEMPGLGVKAFF